MSLLIPNAQWSLLHTILVGVVLPAGLLMFAIVAMCVTSKRDNEAVERWEAERLAAANAIRIHRSPDPRDEWTEGLVDEDPRLLMPEIRDFLAGVR